LEPYKRLKAKIHVVLLAAIHDVSFLPVRHRDAYHIGLPIFEKASKRQHVPSASSSPREVVLKLVIRSGIEVQQLAHKL